MTATLIGLAVERNELRWDDLPHRPGSEGTEDFVEREGLTSGERHGDHRV